MAANTLCFFSKSPVAILCWVRSEWSEKDPVVRPSVPYHSHASECGCVRASASACVRACDRLFWDDFEFRAAGSPSSARHSSSTLKPSKSVCAHMLASVRASERASVHLAEAGHRMIFEFRAQSSVGRHGAACTELLRKLFWGMCRPTLSCWYGVI